MADALQLTDNAVRAQLATLERDGLVRLGGGRAGSRKPNLTYEATGDAERLLAEEGREDAAAVLLVPLTGGVQVLAQVSGTFPGLN